MRRVSLESAYQIIDKENIKEDINSGLKNTRNHKKKSDPLSPLRTRKVKRSAIAGLNTKKTPPRFQSINIQKTKGTTTTISNSTCIDSSSTSKMDTNYTQQAFDIGKEEDEDFSFAKLKGAVQKFEQKQKEAQKHKIAASNSTATFKSAPQNCNKLDFKGNIYKISNTSQTIDTLSSGGSSSSSSTSSNCSSGKFGFGNVNKITSCSSFGTAESNTISFSASSWSGDFAGDNIKNTATQRTKHQKKGNTATAPLASESTLNSASVSSASIPGEEQNEENNNEDFSFEKLKQKALGMEKAAGGKKIILPCPQEQRVHCKKEEEEEEEDFSFESLKQKALKAPSTPIRKRNNNNRIAPHTICARPRRSHGLPTYNASSLSFTPRSNINMSSSTLPLTPRSNSTPKERSQHFSANGGNGNVKNFQSETKTFGHHTFCEKSRRSLGSGSSGITPSVLFHSHRSHSTPKNRAKEGSNDNSLQTNLKGEMKTSTFNLNRFQFKPKIKKEEVQATNDSIASVQKLSKWLSDDPFDKKKQLMIRKGEQIANKSKAFEHEELVNGKLNFSKQSRAQREKHYFPTGKVSQNKDWLQNRAFGDGSNKKCDDRGENCGVMGKKQLIESALKKRPCAK